MIVHSIRWRLQIWHGLILVLVLAAFGFTAHRLQRGDEMRRVDQGLQHRLRVELDSLRPRPPGGRPNGPTELRPYPAPEEGGFPPPEGSRSRENFSAQFEGDEERFYVIVWGADGKLSKRSENAPEVVFQPPLFLQGMPRSQFRMQGNSRELYEFTPPGECILVGRSIAPEMGHLRQLALWMLLFGGVVLTLGLAGGWWLATRAIRPIHEITEAAAKIAGGDLSHRISATETDSEFGQLAAVLNSTFARLDAAFTQQARFTSDASHELRTPVTVILSQTQTTLARERSAADYRATVETCQRAAQRMRRLIESLLQLARFDGGQESFRPKPCDLAEVARESIEIITPLADEKGVKFGVELKPARCMADPERLGQVMANLLTNAIVHNRSGGEVRVSVFSESPFAVITVTDTGPGIAEADLPRIFERFYRADASRTGATGGTGLGLAISKAIVEAHGGRIFAASQIDRGCTFTVKLPLSV